eukprot:gene26384-31880_t
MDIEAESLVASSEYEATEAITEDIIRNHEPTPHEELKAAKNASTESNIDNYRPLGLSVRDLELFAEAYASYRSSDNGFQANSEKCINASQDVSESKIRDDLYKVVTLRWHPLYLALMEEEICETRTSHQDFLSLCEKYASQELEVACSQEMRASLVFVYGATRTNIRLPETTDYSNVARTIAYIISSSAPDTVKDVDSVLTLQADLIFRRQRCAVHLATRLKRLNQQFSWVVSEELTTRLTSVEEQPVKSAIFSPSSVTLPSADALQHLLKAGLTHDVLDAISSFYGFNKTGQLKSIELEVDRLNIDRIRLLANLKDTRRAVKTVVTLNWHPFQQVMLLNEIITYGQFLAICQVFAKEALKEALTEKVQDRLAFVVTSGCVRKATLSNYSDIATTIAYTIALLDPAYMVEGVTNDDYLLKIRNALKAKLEHAYSVTTKRVLRVDLKNSRSLGVSKTPSLRLSDDATLMALEDPMLMAQRTVKETDIDTPMSIFPAEDNSDSDEETMVYGSFVELDTSILSEEFSFPHGLPSKAHLKPLLDAGAFLKLNLEETRRAIKTLVIMRWHPWKLVILLGKITSYKKFLSICEAFAKDELALSETLKLQDQVVSVNGIDRVEHPEYFDIRFCIAAVRTLHNLNSKEDSIKGNSFFYNMRKRLLRHRADSCNWVCESVLTLGDSASIFTNSLSGSGDSDPHKVQESSSFREVAEEKPISSTESFVTPQVADTFAAEVSNKLSENSHWLMRKYGNNRECFKSTDQVAHSAPINAEKTNQSSTDHSGERSLSVISGKPDGFQEESSSPATQTDDASIPYPAFDKAVAIVEAQFWHPFFMREPLAAGKFLLLKCIQLLDIRDDVTEAKRANAKQQLLAKYGRELQVSQKHKSVTEDELRRINDRIWHNYLKLHREGKKKAEESVTIVETVAGVKRKLGGSAA